MMMYGATPTMINLHNMREQHKPAVVMATGDECKTESHIDALNTRQLTTFPILSLLESQYRRTLRTGYI